MSGQLSLPPTYSAEPLCARCGNSASDLPPPYPAAVNSGPAVANYNNPNLKRAHNALDDAAAAAEAQGTTHNTHAPENNLKTCCIVVLLHLLVGCLLGCVYWLITRGTCWVLFLRGYHAPPICVAGVYVGG